MAKNIMETVFKFLPGIKKPGRYIGGEINAVIKDPQKVSLSMAICYPDIYEIGMSNLGIRIIYDTVNSIEKYSCERVFAPWPDFEEYLRKYSIPLYSLENFRALNEFDVVGFSIGYELLYTGVLNILDLGRIPIFSKEREDSDPIIIAGGPGIYNPEPGADFIDAFVFGDGETAIIEILEMLEKNKDKSREEKLQALDKLPYTYVPIFYPVKEDRGYKYTIVEKRIRRKIEPDLDKLPFSEKPIVPLLKVVQERITLEVDRGCVNGCRFCQAGYIYRPARERSVETLLNLARKSIKYTGYDEIALLSLSIADYSELERLSMMMVEEFAPLYVSLSLPSLRVNSVNLSILECVQKVRKSGLTFAVETPDDKARAGLNKIVSEDQLESLIKEVKKLGWRLIKLYFMIGIPYIDNEDDKTAAFINKLLELERGLALNVNVSVFVPKPHTPLEREKQLEPEEAFKMLSRIKKLTPKRKVRIKYTSPWMSQIEGILSRGDRAISDVLYEVFRNGERLSGWEEYFDYQRWMNAFSALGIDPSKYLCYMDKDIRLPWYFIDSGINEDFKRDELDRFYKGEQTESCKYGRCGYCGACKGGIKNVLASNKKYVIGKTNIEDRIKTDSTSGKEICYNSRGYDRKISSDELRAPESKPSYKEAMRDNSGVNIYDSKVVIKVAFVYTKLGQYRFFSQLDMQNLFIRIGRIANIPFRYTEGFNPRPKINLPYAIPVGIESEYELGEICLAQLMDHYEFIEKYNEKFESLLYYKGLKIIKAKLSESRKTIFTEHFFHDYMIEGDIEHFIKKVGYFLNKLDSSEKDSKEFIEKPEEGYFLKEDKLFIRLCNTTSIKKFLNEQLLGRNLRITRKVIWKLLDGKLYRFL